jgi:hypothetical protein
MFTKMGTPHGLRLVVLCDGCRNSAIYDVEDPDSTTLSVAIIALKIGWRLTQTIYVGNTKLGGYKQDLCPTCSSRLN